MTWLYFVFVQSVFVFVGQTLAMAASSPGGVLGRRLVPGHPVIAAEVVYAARHEAGTYVYTVLPIKRNRSTHQVKPFYLSSETVLPIK
jgi:hypothetical protein